MGYDDRIIADMLGQRTLAMAQHYLTCVNYLRKLRGTVENFETEINRIQKELSNFFKELSNRKAIRIL